MYVQMKLNVLSAQICVISSKKTQFKQKTRLRMIMNNYRIYALDEDDAMSKKCTIYLKDTDRVYLQI